MGVLRDVHSTAIDTESLLTGVSNLSTTAIGLLLCQRWVFFFFVQADVDLVSIMRRTGFLPSESQQPQAASLVTQGGSRVGQVQGAEGRQASDGALQNVDTAKGGWQADALSPPRAAAAAATVSANVNLYNMTYQV